MQEADRECEFYKHSCLLLKIAVVCTLSKHVEHAYVLVRSGKKQAKQEDLKEMGDISSGMSSSIMQIYLKQVLESFFHSQSTVRHFALSVVTLTLSQGLIHPVQVCSPS